MFLLRLIRRHQQVNPDTLEPFVQSLRADGQRDIIQQILLDTRLRQVLLDLYDYEVFAIAKELSVKEYQKWNGQTGVIGGVRVLSFVSSSTLRHCVMICSH